MPLSEYDTQELRQLLYLRAEDIERQERLQYLRQTWKSSIWSEEDDDYYMVPDPEIPSVYSLHYEQQCPPEWDDRSIPAETADRQKKKEHGKNNLHAEEDILQKIESLNLDPQLKKPVLTYEEVFGTLPPPLSCKRLVQMDHKPKSEFENTRVRRRPYPALQEQVARSRNVLMLASLRNIRRGSTPTTAVLASWSLNQDRLPCHWLLTMVRSTRKAKTTERVFPTWKTRWSVLPNAGTKPKWTNAVVFGRLT